MKVVLRSTMNLFIWLTIMADGANEFGKKVIFSLMLHI